MTVRIRTIQPALDLKQELRKIPSSFPGHGSRRAAIRVQKQRTGISPGKKTFTRVGKQIARAEQGRKTNENREQMVGQSRPGLMLHGGKSLGLLNRRVEGRMKRNWRLSLKPCVELIYPALGWEGRKGLSDIITASLTPVKLHPCVKISRILLIFFWFFQLQFLPDGISLFVH